MGRARSPNRDKAYEMYKESKGKIKPKAIADALGENVTNVYTWKKNDNWDRKLKGNVGAPAGNKNAVGNKGGAPKGNLNNFKDGSRIPAERFASKKFLAKYLPKATSKIIDDVSDSSLNSLDILWMNIELQVAAILRSQKIMHVKNQKDLTKELKREKYSPGKFGDGTEEEYELQFAWDKQERFLTAQSKAIKTLNDLIKNYEELLHKNWDLATEEQKARIEVLKSKVVNNDKDKEDKLDKYFEALEGAFKNA